MAEDPNIVSILASAFSDPLHAKRMAELLEALGKAEAAKADALAAKQEAEDKLAEAVETLREAERIRTGAQALTAGFDEKNRGLAASIETHNADKTAFGNERSAIEQGHRDRQADLDAEATRQHDRANELTAFAAELDEQKSRQEAKETELAEREAHLDGIVAQLSGKGKAA